jgi:hypothetical protein
MLRKMETHRRSFLAGLGGLAVATQLPGPVRLARAADGDRAYCPPPSAWTDLAKAMQGPVLLPEDPNFADVCRPNNLRYNIPPQGIARCEKAEDVLACINWVKKHNKPFAVRSGGHNYAGFSSTPGLLIDMSLMKGVEPVGNDGLVRIEGGVLNSKVYKELERMGRTITHGRCDGVGAAGFLLGGGIGFNMRRFGIGSDLLTATDLVTAEGELHSANDTHDRDLFWACRGGAGGNFGINTAFTLQTRPVSTVSVCKLTWDSGDLAKLLHGLLKQLNSAPADFGSKITITMPSLAQRCAGKGISVSVMAQLHKCSQSMESIFGDYWKTASKKSEKKDVAYWAGQDFLGESPYPYYYQEKSSYMMASNLTEAAIGEMMELAHKMPGTAIPVAFKFYQLGGVINQMKPTETAYVHRGFDWLFTVEMNWWQPTDPPAQVEANLLWQQSFYNLANQQTKAVGAYQNFSDPTLGDWPIAYYGENYPRLQKVKKAVDPTSLFTFAQAIQPA